MDFILILIVAGTLVTETGAISVSCASSTSVEGRRQNQVVTWTETSITQSEGVVKTERSAQSGDTFQPGVTRVFERFADSNSCEECFFTITVNPGTCQSGQQYILGEGGCFRLTIGSYDFDDANYICGRYYLGELASVHSQEAHDYIRDVLLPYNAYAFIGLHKSNGNWGWYDGTPVDFTAYGSDWEEIAIQLCTIMDQGYNYMWEETSCDEKYKGVCKQPAFPAPEMSNCPDTIKVLIDPGTNIGRATWTDPTASSTYGSASALTSSHQSGDEFPVGMTTVTISSSNDVGTSVCTFVVHVQDNETPVFDNCPTTDVVFDILPGEATITYASPGLTATDNDAVSSIDCKVSDGCPGDVLGPGTYGMRFVAKDPYMCNLHAICTFDVIVRDVVPPTITCGSDISQLTDSGEDHAVINWSTPAATDNIAVSTVTCTPNSGSQIQIGNTVVNCDATDPSGNTDHCSFNIDIEDTEPPEIVSCPNTVTGSLEDSNSWGIGNWADPVFDDNSNQFTTSGSHSNGQQFPLGVTTVQITATDDAGLSVICTFDVDINDITPPVFSICPDDVTTNTATGEPTTDVTWDLVAATDNSGESPSINDTRTQDTFQIGESYLAISAVDSSNNIALCEFTITVIDDELPVFTYCPPDIHTPSEPGLPSATIDWQEPVVTDNSGLEPTISQTRNSGSVFTIGSETVTYEATDSSSNQNTCAFDVITEDEEHPEFTNCPTDIEDVALDTSDFTQVTWVAPSSTDNSGDAPVVTVNFQSGDNFYIGDTDVVYNSTDEAGNFNTCEFTITIIDITAPVFRNCPQDLTGFSDPNVATTIVSWDYLNATDNSGENPLIADREVTSMELQIGFHLILFTAEDAAGNIAYCQFNITVLDDQSPVIHNCPANVTVSTDHRMPTATVFWDSINATDNSGEAPTMHHSHLSGDEFTIGFHTGNITAVDPSMNTITCVFHILVEDTEAPVFYTCPMDITVNTEYRLPSARVEWDFQDIIDNSGHHPVVTTNYVPGEAFTVGQTQVIYTASDGASNVQNCSFVITVLDLEKPYFIYCPSDISIGTDDGLYTAVVNWTQPSASDNSQIPPTITSDHNTGDVFLFSTTTVTFRAIDEAANFVLCQFEIDVFDDEPPDFVNMTSDIEIFIDATETNSSVEWNEPLSTDNSMIPPTISSTHSSGDIFIIGNTRVVYTATDPSGNSVQFTFNVNIRVAFQNLGALMNGSSLTDKLRISGIASKLANPRQLSNNEIDMLSSVIIELADGVFVSDRDIKQTVEDVVSVTDIVVYNENKEINKQIDMIIATEKVMQQVVNSEENVDLIQPSKHVVSSISPIKSRNWTVHISKDGDDFAVTKDNSVNKKPKDKCYVTLDANSARGIDETATIVATYYDKDVIIETQSDSIEMEESIEDKSGVPYTLATGLLSYSIGTNTTSFQVSVEFSMELDYSLISSDETYFTENALCVFWHVSKRIWSTTGCKNIGYVDRHVKCKCDHTTTFGIFTPVEKPVEEEGFDYARLGERLGIYSICIVSFIAIFYVAKFINTIWGLFRGPGMVFIYSNLLLSTFCATILFIVNSEVIEYHLYCNIFGVLLHFFYMSILLWLTVESVHLFMRANQYRVQGSPSKRIGYATFAYGGSLVIAAVFFGIHHGYGDSEGCWLKFEAGGLVAFVFPSMTLIVARITLLVLLSLRKIKGSKGSKRAEEIKLHLRHCTFGSLYLVPHLILTWAFVILADREYLYWLIFYILFSSNGITISVYCYFSKDITDVRDDIKLASILIEEKRHSIASTVNTTISEFEPRRMSIITIESYDDPIESEEISEAVSETKLNDDAEDINDEPIDQLTEPVDTTSESEADSTSSSSSSDSEDEETNKDDIEEKEDESEDEVEKESQHDSSSDNHDSDDDMFR
ncbi:uncharacterized protein [Antedon mediterranea]|uniref:uncharacterized protein n=1 Tax=Antedon mediterranea TaxID=105859 RepID=UPI003AF9E618